MLCPHAPGKFFGLLSGLLLFLVTTAPAQAVDCYTWTDQNGQVHITTAPPPPGARDVTAREFEYRGRTVTPVPPSTHRTVVVPAPSPSERVTAIDPASIKIERERLQAEIIRLERAKQKSSFALGISKYDRNGNEKMRAHQEKCDRKIRELGRRMEELRRDPVRYAYKYRMILY